MLDDNNKPYIYDKSKYSYNEFIKPLKQLLKYLDIELDSKCFILLNNDKKPIHKYKDTDNYSFIDDKFIKHITNGYQIALYSPKSKFIVLDFDIEESYHKFKKMYPGLKTFTIKTKRGYHVYLKTDLEYKRIAPMKDFFNLDKVDLLPCQKGYYSLFYNNQDRYIYDDSNVIVIPKQLENELEKYLVPIHDLDTYKDRNNYVNNDLSNNNHDIDLDKLTNLIHEISNDLKQCDLNTWLSFSTNLASLIKNTTNLTYDDYLELVNIYDNGKPGNKYQYYNWWLNKDNKTINNTSLNIGVIRKIYKTFTNKDSIIFFYTLTNKNMLQHFKDEYLTRLKHDEFLSIEHIKDHLNKIDYTSNKPSLFVASVGIGKTTAFIKYALDNNKRMLFVVPTSALVKDLKKKYKDNKQVSFYYGKKNSLKNGNDTTLNSDLISIMTIDQATHFKKLNFNNIKPYDLCIVDEIHIYSSYANISIEKEKIIYSFLYDHDFNKIIKHRILNTATPFNLHDDFNCISAYIRPLNKKVNVLVSDMFTHFNSPTRHKNNKVNYYLEWITRVIKTYDIKPGNKTLIFTNHNSLTIDKEIVKELEKLNYSSTWIHSREAKQKRLLDNVNNYDFKDITLASSILNVGVDFYNTFDNIIIIDCLDINYIIQAINRDRSGTTKVYYCTQTQKRKDLQGVIHDRAIQNFKPYYPKVNFNDISDLSFLALDNIYFDLKNIDNTNYLQFNINTLKITNEQYLKYIRYRITYLDVLDIFDYLNISYIINNIDFIDIDFTKDRLLKEKLEIKDLEHTYITDLVSYEIAMKQLFQKLGLKGKNKNLYVFKELDLKNKLKNSNLSNQYQLLNDLIDSLVNRFSKLSSDYIIMQKYVKKLYEYPNLLIECTSPLSLKIRVFELVQDKPIITNLIDNKLDLKLNSNEFKKLVNDIKSTNNLSIDKPLNKDIENLINELGYKVKKVNSKGTRYIRIVKL